MEPAHLTRRIADLRAELQNTDPEAVAARTAAHYTATGSDRGEFHLAVWERRVSVSFPEFVARDGNSGQEMPLITQVLLLYYFQKADGAASSGRWISFSDLPGGRFYTQAFQGYTGRELAREFQNDLVAFERTATGLGGISQSHGEAHPGDLAFLFQVLPKVPLLVVCWRGDEDFPAAYQILFDASADHYLPVDVCASLGGMLTRKLCTAKRSQHA